MIDWLSLADPADGFGFQQDRRVKKANDAALSAIIRLWVQAMTTVSCINNILTR